MNSVILKQENPIKSLLKKNICLINNNNDFLLLLISQNYDENDAITIKLSNIYIHRYYNCCYKHINNIRIQKASNGQKIRT